MSRLPWKMMVGPGRPALRTCFRPNALPHSGKRRGKTSGSAAGQVGMYAKGRVKIGVHPSHGGGSSPAGRLARDIDALRIDRIVPHDLTGNAGDQRWCTGAPPLIACSKLVPALRLVGYAGLFGLEHEAILLFRQKVQPNAGGEIIEHDGLPIANIKDPDLAADVAERLNEDEARRE